MGAVLVYIIRARRIICALTFFEVNICKFMSFEIWISLVVVGRRLLTFVKVFITIHAIREIFLNINSSYNACIDDSCITVLRPSSTFRLLSFLFIVLYSISSRCLYSNIWCRDMIYGFTSFYWSNSILWPHVFLYFFLLSIDKILPKTLRCSWR